VVENPILENPYSMSLMIKSGLRVLLASCLIAAGSSAHAQLNVLVTGVGSTQFPIATANFAGEANSPQQVSTIVRQDLQRSGKFTTSMRAPRLSLKRIPSTSAAGRPRVPTHSSRAA